MVQKKDAKGRLDKYYRLAKDQGYRARSAFKLIQLNNQFSFLQNAKCLVDLCAAPGGWCQVATNVMPKPSIVIGIDLTPIKPIPNVITFVQDITSDKTKHLIKNEIKNWDVDVVLHDGAPNVGSSWLHDAFQQSQLVLHALKLATHFLAKNGTFVTKVFRSKDYNNLLWVFNQLFDRVEATKPAASRAVSAEIFVVCMGYKKPDKIDPKLLDLKNVFKELEDVTKNQASMMNDLMHPEKRKRHRTGYADGDYTLFTAKDAWEFISSDDYVSVLSNSNKLEFTSLKESQDLKNHVLTSEEVLQSCLDLKVLGKKDFKILLKWREQIRISLNLEKPKKELHQEKETEKTVEQQMELEHHVSMNREKKDKKKSQERKAKALQKMNLGMETPMDIGIEAADAGLYTVEGGMVEYDSEEFSDAHDSEDEQRKKLGGLEQEMDYMYNEYKARKLEKDPLEMIKEEKRMQKKPAAQDFEEWYGVEYDAKKRKMADESDASDDEEKTEKPMGYNSDSSSDSNDSNQEDVEIEEPIILSKAASSFFANPLFDTINMSTTSTVKPEPNSNNNHQRKQKKQKITFDKESDDESEDFEVVSNKFKTDKEVEDSDDDNTYAIKTAAAYTIAQQLASNSGKKNAIDASFSRYAFHDTNLPTWFAEDEKKHIVPNIPVTKEAILLMKERMKALDARPIKKVAEAKFRKQIRSLKRMDKLKKKADGLLDDEENQTKLTDIQKMLNKGMKKKPDKMPTLVVAKGSRKGLQGRPGGVKGRYKMVDPRMKKEMRADKRGKRDAKNPNRR